MTHRDKILIIEDELNVANIIEKILINNNYKVVLAANAATGLSLCTSWCPDLILLDLGLPDMDGIEVISRIREFSWIPIIVVSSRVQEREKVRALDTGADDYITKPFGLEELLARIRAALRNSNVKTAVNHDFVYEQGGLRIDFGRRLVTLDGKPLRFTPVEYKLVSLLAKQAGQVLTYSYLLERIWGPYTDTNNQILRVNMTNIRRKLKEDPAAPKYILTEAGVGYRMQKPKPLKPK